MTYLYVLELPLWHLFQRRIQGFQRGVAFVKEGGDYSLSWITKICELGACFSYFPYVLAQNGGGGGGG